MPMFAVIGFDHPPHNMPERDRLRPEHRAFVKANDSMIRLASAMLTPNGEQCGSVYIFEADSIDQVRDWTTREPFCQGDVYKNVHIVEVGVAVNQIPQMDWPV